MASQRPPRALRRILPANSAATVGPPSSLDIVIVPAPGLAKPLEWTFAPSNPPMLWLQHLLDDLATSFAPGATIWEHHYDSLNEPSFVEYLFQEGNELVELLLNHCVQTDMVGKMRPLVLICHGTGGLVVKRALHVCRHEQVYQYRRVTDVLSGAIFLGTPHITEDWEAANKTLRLLVKCQGKKGARPRLGDDDVTKFIKICKDFDIIPLDIPVLSAYETKGAVPSVKLFHKIFNKESKHVIVTRALGTLGSHIAEYTEVDCISNHLNICRVSLGSELYRECVKFLGVVGREAPARVASNTEAYDTPARLISETLHSGTDSLQYRSTRGSNPRLSYAEVNRGRLPEFDEAPSKNPNLPCFWVSRRRNSRFIGRQEVLQRIDDVLLSLEVGQLRSFAVCGIGGIGKTELAIEYAYSRRDRFEAIFWLRGEETSVLASSFSKIAVALGLEDDSEQPKWPRDTTHAASREIVMHWLGRPLKDMSAPESPENFANWLIIFDNVKDVDVLSDHWPKFGRGSVLITSRDPIVTRTLYAPQSSRIDLMTLSKQESKDLLQNLTQVEAEPSAKEIEAVDILAEALGGFPIAINQMSNVLRWLNFTSYSELLEHYNQYGISGAFLEPTGSTNMPQPLGTLWELDRLSQSSMALLRVMSLLGPEISEDILIDLKKVVRLEHYPTSLRHYYAAIDEMVASSLTIREAETRKLKQFTLLQKEIRGMMQDDELISVYQAASDLLIEIWPFQGIQEHHSVARFSECEVLLPSIRGFRNNLATLHQSGFHDSNLTLRVVMLFNDVGWYMLERGMLENAQSFCQLASNMLNETVGYGGDQFGSLLLANHMSLGIILAEMNNRKQSMFHKRTWLDMLKRRKTPTNECVEDYELGYAYNEIGVGCAADGKLDEAETAFQRSIKIFEGLDDYQETMLADPQTNLGFIFWMRGELKEAEHVLCKMKDTHAASWGVDDIRSFKTGKILYGIGNVLWAQGRFKESFNYHSRCLTQYKATLGDHHYRVGDVYHRLALYYIHQGLNDDAETYLNQALDIYKLHLCLKNSQARTRFMKGQLYQKMNKPDEAQVLLKEAFELRRELVPKDLRPMKQLVMTDFDLLVPYWSR
ncbi:hypothetical protein QBC32DRAFT_224369 [Pseudoneurospora amorphoporcata]|uniref:NB-ARC domain-containing protein n=1 Tax=Pseudoneurospora amorphoporcata TaxID=241081 RepID=A0AAN6NKQ5_9PEZI|nr:hypothetical protein QBC32DRAFT_224369 [Pseudoneurospora amorphoporcata]